MYHYSNPYYYGYPYYYGHSYYNSTPYFNDYRSYYPSSHYFGNDQHNEYPYYYDNQTDISARVDLLGKMWVGQEKEWKWTWVRRGNTNTFDAIYKHPHDPPIRAVIYITLNGNQVTAQRRQATSGGDCDYVGVIQGNSVSGTYTCQQGTGTTWSATIEGQGGTTPPPPPPPPSTTGQTSGTGISFEEEFLGVFRVRGTVYPDRKEVRIQGYILGINVSNTTYTLEDRELVFERTSLGKKYKLIIGLKPSGRTIYSRGEIKLGGRIVGQFGPTTIASW